MQWDDNSIQTLQRKNKFSDSGFIPTDENLI